MDTNLFTEDEEIAKLKKDIVTLTSCVNEMAKILATMESQCNNNSYTNNFLISNINNLTYEVNDPRPKSTQLFYPNILGFEDTVKEIICNHKSISRFGDGEFSLMENVQRQPFQEQNDLLSLRLKEVIASNLDNLLIGIPDHYGSLTEYTAEAAFGIRNYLTRETRMQNYKYFSSEKTYYNSYFSRPYVIYADSQWNAAKRFNKIKSIWENRDVIIVEGAHSRCGVNNDLLSNVKSIRRILAPATSSFRAYDCLLSSAIANASSDTMFLLVLGPTASVLSYDLCVQGFQAIDLGHTDLEYEWFLAGKGQRTPVPGKYNNELDGGDQVTDENLPASYFSEIIADFSR